MPSCSLATLPGSSCFSGGRTAFTQIDLTRREPITSHSSALTTQQTQTTNPNFYSALMELDLRLLLCCAADAFYSRDNYCGSQTKPSHATLRYTVAGFSFPFSPAQFRFPFPFSFILQLAGLAGRMMIYRNNLPSPSARPECKAYKIQND